MATSAGDAYVDILPSFQRFGAALNKGIDPELKRSATHIGNELAKDLEPEGRKAGKAAGEGLDKGLSGALQNVGALVKQREELRALAAEYTRIGAAAEKGSAEQIAASKLAEKAIQKLGDAQEVVVKGGDQIGSSAKKAFSSVGTALSSANLDMNPLTGSLAAVSTGFAHMDESAGKFSKTAVVAGLGAAGVGAALTRMGEESRQASAQLQQAIENSGNVFSDFAPKVEAVSNRLIKLGFDDEATARSLATLTTALQDPAKALDMMGLAADIAASKHISLEDASKKLALAQNGNTRVLKEFGIQLDANATAAERAAAFTELAARVQGQAEGQADSFVGKLTAMRIQFENVAEAVGQKAGPALTVLGPLLAGVGGLAQASEGGLRGLASSAGALLGPVAAIGAAVGVLAIGLGQMNDKIKLSGETMRDLATASTPALVRAFTEMEKLNRFGFDTSATFRTLAETSFGAAQRLVEGLEAAGSKSGFTSEQIAKLRGTLNEVATANRQAATDAEGNAAATEKVMTAAERAAGQVQNLTTGLNLLIGVHVSASQAATTYHDRLDEVSTKLAENGAHLDITSEKGRENRNVIDNLISGITAHITSLANEGATMDDLKSNFDSHIGDLRRVLEQSGFTREEIDALIAKYGLVPENVDTFLAIHGETAYKNALDNARRKAEEFNSIAGVKGTVNAAFTPAAAAGAILNKRVGSGFVTNQPRAIVGEGGSHPEYVIPTDPRHRERAAGLFIKLGEDLNLLSAGGVIGVPMMAAGGIVDRPDIAFELAYDFSAATSILKQATDALVSAIAAAKAAQASSLAGSSTGLDPAFLDQFNRWNASRGNDLSIVSGFRSRAEQEVLYARYLAGTGNLAARPGTSMHEKGLAIDHAPSSWAMDAGAREFRLHHPVSGEPWHVEPMARGGIIGEFGASLPAGMIQGLSAEDSRLRQALLKMADTVTGTITEALQIHSPSAVFHGYGVDLTTGLIEGVQQGMPEVENRVTSLGSGLAAGLAQGVGDGEAGVRDSLAALSDAAKASFVDAWQIASPSGVTYGYGTDLVQGLINGMESLYGMAKESYQAFLADLSAMQPHGTENVSASGGYEWFEHPSIDSGYYSDADLARISESQGHGPHNISASGGYQWAEHPTMGWGYFTDAELSFQRGGIVNANLHHGEMVLPADISEFIQDSVGRGSGGVVTLHPDTIKALAREFASVTVVADVDRVLSATRKAQRAYQ